MDFDDFLDSPVAGYCVFVSCVDQGDQAKVDGGITRSGRGWVGEWSVGGGVVAVPLHGVTADVEASAVPTERTASAILCVEAVHFEVRG
jgi:hypothetical protein